MEGRSGTQDASFYRISIQRITAETPKAGNSLRDFPSLRGTGAVDTTRLHSRRADGGGLNVHAPKRV